MNLETEINALSNKIITREKQLDTDREKLIKLMTQQAEKNRNMPMKNRTFLIFNKPEQIALCYVKDVDGDFIDGDSIFCSDNEITLSFNDRFHVGSLKEVKEKDKPNIQKLLNDKMTIFRENIDKFCSSYGKKEDQ